MINRTQEEIMKNWGVENTDTPLVSVKCMTFNHEKFIGQALDGFLMQKTTFPFEVLVHDDASTDKTADIIREYEKKFPKIIKGIYENENQWSKPEPMLHHKKINAAIRGKYIALCEGDDYWIDENKLQMQVDFLEKNVNYSMTFHRARILNELNIPCGLHCENIENRDYTANEVFLNWIVPTASIVCRKNVVEIKNKTKYSFLNGDLVLILNCFSIGKVRGFSNEMSIYRMQSTGVTYDKKLQKIRNLRYPEHFMFIMDNFPFVDRKLVKKALSYSYVRIFKCDKKEIKWLIKAFFTSPVKCITYPFTFLYRKIFN